MVSERLRRKTFESSDLFRAVCPAPPTPKTFLNLWTTTKKKKAPGFHPPPPLRSFTAAFLAFLHIQKCGISGAWAFVEVAGGPAGISTPPRPPPRMGSLPIMGIRGGHNEARRATTTAAVTRFPSASARLWDVRKRPSSCWGLSPLSHFTRSRKLAVFCKRGDVTFLLSANGGTSTGADGKTAPLSSGGKARLRSFSRSAGKRGADVHGGQKRSQKCASDQQEHVSQNVFCGRNTEPGRSRS